MIQAVCGCGRSFEVPPSGAGQPVECPDCRALVAVPMPPRPGGSANGWKLAAAAAAAVAVLSMGLTAVLALSGDPKATELAVRAGAERGREVERLRQSIQDRDRELEELKQELSRGEDVSKLEKYLREIEDLRRAKQQLEHATTRAVHGREEWMARLKAIESAAPPPPAPPPPAPPPPAPPPPAPATTAPPPAAEKLSLEAAARAAIPAVALVRADAGTVTGFFVQASGELLTNYHGIIRSKKIEVEYAVGGERKTAPARAVAIDPQLDLALLRVEGAPAVPVLTLRPGNPPVAGERVVLVGNPRFGKGTLEHTVADGVVSGVVRTNLGRTLLQTTAPINDGADGGPLLDLRGAVVGVATARAQDVAGIGFAVPSASALKFLADRDLHAVGGSQAEWEIRKGILPPITHDPSLGIPIDGMPTRLLVSEDGDRIAALDSSVNGVHVISLLEKKVLARIYTHSDPVDMALAPGGRNVWVVHKGASDVIRVDLEKAAIGERLTMPQHHGRRVAVSKTHLWVAPASEYRWNAYSFREKTWVTTLHHESVNLFAYDPRRDVLLQVGSSSALLEAQADRVYALSLAQLRLTPQQGKERQALLAEYAKLFKPHKQQLPSYSFDSLMWTEERTGRLFLGRAVFKLDNLGAPAGTLPSAELSQAKRTAWWKRVSEDARHGDIVAASRDGLWVATGTHVHHAEKLAVSKELPMPTTAVAFSKDSKTLWFFDFVNKVLMPLALGE